MTRDDEWHSPAHSLCDQCEWVSTCQKRGACIPIASDEPITTPERTMRWADVAWAIAIGICVAAIVVPLMVR